MVSKYGLQYLRLIVFVQMTPQSPVFRNGGGSDGRRFVHAPRNLHQLAPVAAFDHVAVLIHTSCFGRALEAHAVFVGDAAHKTCRSVDVQTV